MTEPGRPVPREAIKAAEAAFSRIISEGGVMEPAIPAAIAAATPALRAEWERELTERAIAPELLEFTRRQHFEEFKALMLSDAAMKAAVDAAREQREAHREYPPPTQCGIEAALATFTDTSEEKCERCGGCGEHIIPAVPGFPAEFGEGSCPTCNGTGTKQPVQGKEQSE